MSMRSLTLPPIPVLKSITDMRYRSKEIVYLLTKEERIVYITKGGDPIGVLMPMTVYKRLAETIEQMEDQLDKEILLDAIQDDKSESVDFASFDFNQRRKRGIDPYVSDLDQGKG